MSQNFTYQLVCQREPERTLDSKLYYSDQTFQDDLEQIWYKEWIFAGHSFEINKAGEYLTLQIGQYPIIIVRGDKGEIRAFHNVCRHRGSRLCEHAKGKSAKLVCPYHKWTYGLDGKLIFAGHTNDNFEKENNGLMPVHCEVVNSYIFVCVADEAPDFEKFRATHSHFTTPHNLENCKVAHEMTLVEGGNWKLVWENNRECYHCDGSHPELLQSYIDNTSVAGIAGGEDPEILEHWEKCEKAGLPSRMVMDEQGQYRIARIPLARPDAYSFTMDAQPAVKGRLDNSGVDNIGDCLFFHYPSTWNHILGDHALTFRVLPLASGETMVTTKWLVPRDAVEGVDYDLDNLTKVWIATNQQDRQLVTETHRGISSPAYIPGQYSGVIEAGVDQFLNWYCDTIKRRLG